MSRFSKARDSTMSFGAPFPSGLISAARPPLSGSYEAPGWRDMACFEAAGVNALGNADTQLLVYESLTALAQNKGNNGPMTDSIRYGTPKGMYAAKEFKKGELSLAPLTTLSRIVNTNDEKEPDGYLTKWHESVSSALSGLARWVPTTSIHIPTWLCHSGT